MNPRSRRRICTEDETIIMMNQHFEFRWRWCLASGWQIWRQSSWAFAFDPGRVCPPLFEMRASGPTREREPVDIQVGACPPTRAPLQLQTIDIEIFINFHPYKSGEAAELYFFLRVGT